MRTLLLFLTLLGMLTCTHYGHAGNKQPSQDAPTGIFGALDKRMSQVESETGRDKTPERPVLKPENTRGVLNDITGDIQRAQQSRLERQYNDRLDSLKRPLEQFGYAMLAAAEPKDRQGQSNYKNDIAMPPGAVQDDYILQSGDTVYVIIRGQRQHRSTYEVRSSGRLVIKNFSPVSAAGRSIAEVREDLRQQAEKLTNTRIYLALHDIKGLGIDVIGHVEQPGQYRLTSFHTVVDALRKAGGVHKSGSLRRITLVRHDGKRHTIDLYNYLLDKKHDAGNAEKTVTKRLRPGDRIIVPPIGPTVAAAGAFQRPGIYELVGRNQVFGLTERGSQTTLAELAGYTGGAMPGASGNLIRMRLNGKGDERIHMTRGERAAIALHNGDIFMLRKREPRRTEHVRVTGHVRSPGIYSLSEAGYLSRLIGDRNLLKPETYPLFAVIKRYIPETMALKYKTFSPLAIKQARRDIKLKSGDRVIFFSASIVRDAMDNNDMRTKKQAARNDNAGISSMSSAETADSRRGRVKKTARRAQTRILAPGITRVSATRPDSGTNIGDGRDYFTPALRKVMRRNTLSVNGNVLHPGRYPVAGRAQARRIIETAGGITGKRTRSRIEITSHPDGTRSGDRETLRQREHYDIDDTDLRGARLEAGDSLRVQSADDDYAIGRARITGAVTHPGDYDLMPGDTLLALIQRAGGLKPQAYPAGAILSRETARKRERQRFRSKARELEMRLARLLGDDTGKDDPEPGRIETMRNIISDLRNARAVGRITVEADPQVLKNRQEQDVLLEDGDHLHIPKRPSTVRVAGEVLSPAALQFESGKTPGDYIQGAGGFTVQADKDRTFIVYPDGSAKPIDVGLWNHAPLKIPPGSTIVVPRDMDEFKLIESARDISQILSNVAVTALFADDIGD